MTSDMGLGADLRGLFADGGVGRTLGVPLPSGRCVTGEGGVGPVLWLSDQAAPEGLWARLREEHARSGLWPLLLDSADDEAEDYPPWGSGELMPEPPGGYDAAVLLAQWWAEYTEHSSDDNLSPAERAAVTSPYAQWPGRAATPTITADPGTIADGLASHALAGHPSTRIGLVPAARGSDALAIAGWLGATNYQSTGELASVLRDWEDRFGARVVAAGYDTLLLSVAAPPTTHADALAVAAEHFAFCPDNIWQGSTLFAYAEQLVGDHSWTFWWD
ncbi:hypothetical protein JOD54_004675 [Actinokineospora baliensis]|uniref:DUF4253 domain-containing protein n=1 Tax=Actinokineospora baliensis TaxID=547056 RepID=UPI0027DC413D|nr:DUF4253 domain-containing protein [Actinokineospora baliensis]MBM7774471.1 hypothetical protein [Actinokineospora baliensis]